MKFKSKAQIETMGLLVIVILISLILFFVLMFSLKSNPDNDIKTKFIRKEAVGNFGPTMLETTVNCSEGRVRTVRELLSDCGFEHEIKCNGMNSCLAANETITRILNLTLDKWDYKYNLTIEKSQSTVPLIIVATGCASSKSSTLEETPFGTTHGQMSMRIRTC